MTEDILAKLTNVGAVGILFGLFLMGFWKTVIPLGREIVEELARARESREHSDDLTREILEFMKQLNGEMRAAVRRAAGNHDSGQSR